MKNINLKTKNSAVNIFANICRYIFFVAFSYILMYPFIYLILNSIMSFADAYDPTVIWIPKNFTFSYFGYALKAFDYWEGFKNTFLYEIVAAMLQFCACAVAAYGLARFSFKGKKFLQLSMILSILVPSMMIITPMYVNYSHLDIFGIFGKIAEATGTDIRPNLIDTPWVFYLPSLLCVGLKGGLFVYIFNQFYKGLPKELEEAAWIDGAGPWRTFLNIVVPSSGTAAITVILFSIVWHWNDYYLAQMFNSANPVLSLKINNFNEHVIAQSLGMDLFRASLEARGIMLAGCLLYVLPLFIFYLLLQRKFVSSIATSGIVG